MPRVVPQYPPTHLGRRHFYLEYLNPGITETPDKLSKSSGTLKEP